MGYAPSKKKNTLALVGLILAILGIMSAFIPFVGFVGIVISLVGLILAIVGFIKSKQLQAGKGLAIAAIIVGAVAVIGGGAAQVMYLRSADCVTDGDGATSCTLGQSADADLPTTGSSSPIDSFDKAQPAVIQITAKGSFRDPEGESVSRWRGSGFIISPDGYAVTNNHVVTGAATLTVYIGGDTTTSYNATVIGASECNDLALIKISGLEDAPYLDWYEGDITVGMEVYAAGFPLGDPEYTLTRGIVAKANADGEMSWASVDRTIEHDANTQPGNSGGPLLTSDGKVAAVHYAGGARSSGTSQFFAIAADLAMPVVARMQEGDFESLGINGEAIMTEDGEIYGVWVQSVKPGSPVDEVGILP
ncbi:MAG: trypsin-like peptidase domain-containing protein, partial [Cellulomonadaceae bacterium]|nr:trypsin-like peptidase domain-containing protein [Cellulomonadaceae bacterium]